MTTGTFRPGDNKVRPGSYFYFKSENTGTPTLSDRGTVIIPLASDWGQDGQAIPITQGDGDNLYPQLGYKVNNLLPLREAFKAANTVIVYPIGTGGVKAKVVVGNLTVEAKRVGTLGNAISVSMTKNLESKYDLVGTLKGETIFHYEGLTTLAGLPTENDWVTFKYSQNTINPESTGSFQLATGANATTDNEAVTGFLNALENYDFNTIAFPYTESALQTAFVSKVKYLREDIGKRVQGVMANYAQANYEGIISVENGVVLSDGTVIEKTNAVYWVAAASAAAGSTGDLTYQAYPDAVECYPILLHSEIVQGLKAGKFMFTRNDGAIRVEEDINTLTDLSLEKDESYTDNRVVRTFDDFMSSASKVLLPNKYPNDEDGLDLVKLDLVNLLLAMEKAGSLKNVDIENDITIDKVQSTGKSLYATAAIQPVRTYKKYYITVNNR